jgi:hypothetical protein
MKSFGSGEGFHIKEAIIRKMAEAFGEPATRESNSHALLEAPFEEKKRHPPHHRKLKQTRLMLKQDLL